MAVTGVPAFVCLVMVGNRRKKIHLKPPCTILDVKQYIRENEQLRALVGNSANVIYQLYDHEFEEFVDVENDSERVYDKSKIKILFEEPHFLDAGAITCIVKEEPQCSTDECRVALDETTLLSIDDNEEQYNRFTVSPGSLAESQKCSYLFGHSNSMVVSSTTNSPDPPLMLGYTLPDFPVEVIRALEARNVVDTRLKRKIIDTIFHDMTNRTLYPGKLYAVAAAALVSCYPHLRDTAGSGYGSWFHGLKWKFKNERRKMRGSDVVDAMRQRYRPRLVVQEQNLCNALGKDVTSTSTDYSMIGRFCENFLPNIHSTPQTNADRASVSSLNLS